LDFIEYLQWYSQQGEFEEEMTIGEERKIKNKSDQSRRHVIERRV